MSSRRYLSDFIVERLTAAAEEIFRAFEQTIVEYEEEANRQRRLLEIVCKPRVKLQRIELPQQHVCKEEEVLTEQQLSNQERNSSLDQEEPESLQIKEEQEEICTIHQSEQLELKQEADASVLTPANEESEAEPDTDHQLLSHSSPVVESQVQTGSNHVDTVSNINVHEGIHTDVRPYSCKTCGKGFRLSSHMREHEIIHTDERPYSCKTCGKGFRRNSHIRRHEKTHTDKRPIRVKHVESVLGKVHIRVHESIHTDETPYLRKNVKRVSSKNGI